MYFPIIILTFSTVYLIIFSGDEIMLISQIRHNRSEGENFRLIRPRGNENFTAFFFRTPVILELGNRKIFLKPGSCILYPPGAPQHFTTQGALLYSWLFLVPEAAGLLKQYKLPLGQPFYIQNPVPVAGLLERMEPEFFSANPYREEMLDSLMHALLILLARSANTAASAPLPKPEKYLDIKEIRQHILSNPQRRWTVADMAKMMSLSPSRFHAVYKEVFGTAPMRDVIEAKIEYAKSLLLSDKRYPLPQVADMLGYNDQYHFIRQFRTETGMTPGAFRKQHQ